MGFRERQHQKVDQRAAEYLRGQLQSGEAIVGVTFGQARPRGWLGLEMLVGGFALFATTYYYLVMTDQRVFMIRLRRTTGRPIEAVWREPHTGVAVDRFKHGRMWMLLYLRRVSDGQIIRFRAQRTAWGATARVTEAAQILQQARAGLPG